MVDHVNDSDKASAALRSIGNHLDASPEARIAVLNHSKGIDFLLDDARDKSGKPCELIVQWLKGTGVDCTVQETGQPGALDWACTTLW